MTNSYESFFNADPWKDIGEACYPEGRRLYVGDQRFWVSRDENQNLVFFVHEEDINVQEVNNDYLGLKVKVINYDNNCARLICSLPDQKELRDKFAIVAKDVAYHCSRFDGKNLFVMILKRIDEWSSFLKPKKEGLEESVYIGLIGELYVLKEAMLVNYDQYSSISSWIGPEDKKFDFAINSIALEVKSTLTGSSPKVYINSIDQLDSTSSNLYLVRLVFNRSVNPKGFSLRSLHYEILDILNLHKVASTEYLRKVSRFYGLATDEQLDRELTIITQQIYGVTDGFPRFTRDHVPYGIDDVKYSIHISSLSDYFVSNDIEEVVRNA